MIGIPFHSVSALPVGKNKSKSGVLARGKYVGGGVSMSPGTLVAINLTVGVSVSAEVGVKRLVGVDGRVAVGWVSSEVHPDSKRYISKQMATVCVRMLQMKNNIFNDRK